MEENSSDGRKEDTEESNRGELRRKDHTPSDQENTTAEENSSDGRKEDREASNRNGRKNKTRLATA